MAATVCAFIFILFYFFFYLFFCISVLYISVMKGGGEVNTKSVKKVVEFLVTEIPAFSRSSPEFTDVEGSRG